MLSLYVRQEFGNKECKSSHSLTVIPLLHSLLPNSCLTYKLSISGRMHVQRMPNSGKRILYIYTHAKILSNLM